jgi:hypothetical protein
MLFELITVDMKKEMMKRFTILRNQLIAAHGFLQHKSATQHASGSNYWHYFLILPIFL